VKILAALLVLLCALPVAAEDAPAKCKLVKIAEWHLRWSSARPIVDGAINGKPATILLSTGNDYSFLSKATATRLELPIRSTSTYFEGVGGGMRVQMARITELKVGGTAAGPMPVRVLGEGPLGADFVLGYDFFKTVDVEFDLANSVARLYRPLDCQGKSLAYWDPDAQQLPMDVSWVPMVTVTVNGHPATARISTGNTSSTIHVAFAEKLGITPSSPGVVSSSCMFGIASDSVHEWIAPLDSIGVAGEMIRNVHLRMGDYFAGSSRPEDVSLGGDFLRAHRVLLSTTQGIFYASYTGGKIFPTAVGLDCDDEVKGMKPEEALAHYDQRIAANPRDAKALVARAVERLVKYDC
jgi:predicted aspartyl protease